VYYRDLLKKTIQKENGEFPSNENLILALSNKRFLLEILISIIFLSQNPEERFEWFQISHWVSEKEKYKTELYYFCVIYQDKYINNQDEFFKKVLD